MEKEKAQLILRKFIELGEEELTEKQLKRIHKALEKASDVYYNSGSDSLVSDKEFDRAVKKYEKYTGEKYYGAPSIANTGKKLVDTEHLFPDLVGTLDKINTIDEFTQWFEKKIKDLNKRIIDRLPLIVSEKEDGNSVVGTFDKNGNTVQWLTRGKEGVGLDLTELFQDVSIPMGITKALEDIGQFGIKFEAVMTDNNLNSYSSKSGKSYASSRAAVAGILSAKDGKKWIKYVQLVPLRIQTANIEKQMARVKEFEIISKLCKVEKKFLRPQYWILFLGMYKRSIVEMTSNTTLVEYIDELYLKENNSRNEEGHRPIDGLVIEFGDNKDRNKLGREKDRNRFDVALKFPYQTNVTTVKDIEFSVGKTGRITPVVVFEPLKFNGNVCDHVSIANYKRFMELGLCKGTQVIIEYRNEVLSYLTPYEDDHTKGKPIPFATECPICHSPIELNETKTFAYCSNPKCPGRNVGKITNWIEKLGIKGINEKIVEKLVEEGLLKNIDSLYKLEPKEIIKIDGFQKKMSEKIVSLIQSKLEITDYELLGSLNIPNFGRSTAKILCRKIGFPVIMNLLENDPQSLHTQMQKIKDIGENTADSFIKGATNNLKLINRLLKYLTVKESLRLENGKEKNIVFSGFRDKNLEKIIEDIGFNYKSSVSSKTNLLLVKSLNENTSKVLKAKELGIEIMELKDFCNKYLDKISK